MKIGVDCDGVLADWDTAFAKLLIQSSGRNLCTHDLASPPCWNWQEFYGYTKEEISAVWEDIKSNRYFWENLKGYNTTSADLDALHYRQGCGDEIYFITARPGTYVKQQTEVWIRTHCYNSDYFNATVLISSHKGLCAQALGLNAYIDDRIKNVMDVVGDPWRSLDSGRRTFIMDRSWNASFPPYPAITRVSSVQEMLDLLP